MKTGEYLSNDRSVDCGVPQSSVRGPPLFTMYTSPLSSIVRFFTMSVIISMLMILRIAFDTADHAISRLFNCDLTVHDFKQTQTQSHQNRIYAIRYQAARAEILPSIPIDFLGEKFYP